MHWHQIWDQFVISVNKLALNFAIKCQKSVNWHLTYLMNFGALKKPFFSLLLQIKLLLIFNKYLSECRLFFQNFKCHIFVFLVFFYFRSFGSVFRHLTFFVIIKEIVVKFYLFFNFFCQTLGTSATSSDQIFDLDEGQWDVKF